MILVDATREIESLKGLGSTEARRRLLTSQSTLFDMRMEIFTHVSELREYPRVRSQRKVDL
jgi:hypothetical protein